MRIFLLFMMLFCMAGCSKKKMPKDILPPEKMQAVYWDYSKADIFANEFIRRDTSKKLELESAKLQQQVFLLHKVTRQQFYKSLDYYLKHKDIMKNMLDTMLVRHKPATAVAADSAKAMIDTSQILNRRKLFKKDTLQKQDE